MTLTQLRAFLSAFENGSFTAAARELSTTQASVSELVARLERELQTKLFLRGSRQLIPTAAATELKPHALRAVTAMNNGTEAIRSLNTLQGGICTFGVLRNAAYYDLSNLVQRFHSKHPKVKVRLVGLNSALVAESITAGEIEAGVLVLPITETGLSVRPLARDEVVYASARRPRTAGPVTIEEVTEAKLVLYDAFAGWKDPTRRQLLERARLRGLTLEPDIEVEHVETAINLVSLGSVDTIVCRAIAQSPSFPKNIHTAPFAEPLHDTLALAQRENAYLSEATKRFAQLAESILTSRLARNPGATQ